jgi:hypothetical protein
MRPRDQNILARELRQQLIACRRSRSRVDVENHRDLGVLQLDALCMDGVAQPPPNARKEAFAIHIAMHNSVVYDVLPVTCSAVLALPCR